MSKRLSAVTVRPNSRHITDQRWFVRIFEILPGLTSWSFFIVPIVVSIFYPILVAYFIVAFDLFWLLKALRMSTYLVRGYGLMKRTMAVNWRERLTWLEDPAKYAQKKEAALKTFMGAHPGANHWYNLSAEGRTQYKQYKALTDDLDVLEDIQKRNHTILAPKEVIHLVIVATYNESRDVLEPTIQSLVDSNIDLSQLHIVIAYEERGGQDVHELAVDLMKTYGATFGYADAVMHPDGMVGELRGKGGNITFAARKMQAYYEQQGIDPERVVVTTLDADNKPDTQYFPYLSYVYATDPNRIRKSYQPIPMFVNNIWDVPAPMRVIATGNSFFQIMEMMRPHRLRNFSSHAQPFRALIETDFWSVTSPVEDGHQFWRSFFIFNGDYKVEPLYMPVYQDAVLAPTYRRTFVGQYKQLRRWAYGSSDFSYVMVNNIRNHNIALSKKVVQTWRLFEGHVSWATATLLITFVAWLPLYLNERFRTTQELAHQLPIIASGIQKVALIGALIMISISIKSLPPRPERYKRRRTVAMVLQWVMLPVTGIVFTTFAAVDAQTRLMFGRYLGFNVTEKSRVTEDGRITDAKES